MATAAPPPRSRCGAFGLGGRALLTWGGDRIALGKWIIGVVVATVFAGVALAQSAVVERLAAGGPPIIAPNRSVQLGGYPENSLAAIAYAIERGIGMVHINPQLTADGGYVLMHDSTLNRTTDVETVFPDGPPAGPTRAQRGGRDYVRDYTLAEIGRLHLIDGQDGGTHPVPTLGEALDRVQGRILVRLGLKVYEVASLAQLLKARPTSNVLLFDAFYGDPNLLRDIASETGIAAAVSMTGSADPITDLGRLAESVGPTLALVFVTRAQLTPDFAVEAERRNIAVGVNGWVGGEDSALRFKNDPAPWQAAIATGAVVLTTREPEALMDLLSE